jgi:hypothetical protein
VTVSLIAVPKPFHGSKSTCTTGSKGPSQAFHQWPVAIGCDLIVKANNDFGVAPSIWQDVSGSCPAGQSACAMVPSRLPTGKTQLDFFDPNPYFVNMSYQVHLITI